MTIAARQYVAPSDTGSVGFALALTGAPADGRPERTIVAPIRWLAEHPFRSSAVTVLCVIAFALATATSIQVFDQTPHVEDEFTYLFQARTIATGRVVAEAPAAPEFFPLPFVMIRDDHWFGKYPPGFPAMLALGELVGYTWLVNPIVGALCVWLVYLTTGRVYGAATGLVASALLVSSPFFVLQAASLMPHVVTLFWLLLFLLAFTQLQERPSSAVAALAGAALGAAFLARPATAAAVAVPYVVWASIRIVARPRLLSGYVALAAGVAPFLAAYLGFNALATGDPLRDTYTMWWKWDRLGFGPGFGPQPEGHTFEQGWLNTEFNLGELARFLFGWPQRLSLLPAALATLLAIWRVSELRSARPARTPALCRPASAPTEEAAASYRTAWDLLHAGTVIALVLGYSAYHMGYVLYPGGPRYYFEATGALVTLSARGLLALSAALADLIGRIVPHIRPRLALASVALGLLVGVLTVLSVTAFVPPEFAGLTRYYRIDGSHVRQVRAAGLDNALVFVQQESWIDYAPFFVQNSPSLDGPVVYALDLGDDANGTLMALYPGRHYFRYGLDLQLVPLASP